MPTLQTMVATRRAAIMLFCLSLMIGSLTTNARAQQPNLVLPEDTARGVELYRRGDTEEAIKVLREVIKKRRDDADAWYYLGLAYKQEGWEGNAREAFENVVNLRPDFADALAKLAFTLILGNRSERALQMAERAMQAGDRSAEAHYVIGEASLKAEAHDRALEEAEQALQINPHLIPALVLKGMAHYGLKQYDKAAESFATLLSISPDNVDAEAWQTELEHLRQSAARAKETQPPAPQGEPSVFTTRQVTAKARVLTKPEPQYTEEARRAGVEGTVVLRAVFSSDGKIKNFFVVSWRPYGLTTRALQAAKRMRFTPASIDGQPVSQYIQIEYNFNLF
jgi:TonB family protein